jgi:PAS domain S-box-containing protein
MTDSHSILVVDDESQSLTLLTGILEAEGFRVRSTNSGQLALPSVAAWLPRLILLDIHMPGIDGFEVCRRLKSSEKTRSVPILFISADRDTEEQVAGLALGAVDYITKPFKREELLARVRTHLELGRLRAHLEEQVSQRTTELRTTVERLRESEERFRNMADTAPVMIWVSATDKLCTFFNKVWLEFTGRTMEQELGGGWAKGVHPDDLDRCLNMYSSSFDARCGFQMEYRLRRADGEYRWVLDQGIPRYRENEFDGFIGSCLDVTEQKRMEERQLASQQQLQMLAGNLLTAQEDERRRLSRELHDDFTQVLASLSIELGRLVTEIPNSLENTRTRIQAMQDRTIQLSAEVRRLAHGLHPSVIEDLGLSIALKEFCHQLGIARAINVYYQGVVEDRSLDKTTATCLYRVAQESLHNSTNHGHATEIHVELTAEAASIHLQVRDNGTGFSIEDARTKTGLGLISMQERIRFVGGTLTVSSLPGKGTEISASVPVAGVGSASRANAAG